MNDQPPASIPPPPLPPATPPPAPPLPPRPQHVHITARPGGFTRAVWFVFGLMVFGVVFIIGIVIGVMSTLATPTLQKVILPQAYRDGGSQTVAIVPVTGVIDGRKSEFVRAAVDKVLSMPDVKAVVLRVNSGGGGVTASDQIWYQVGRLKDSGLPVVASFGGVAASGGYYVSCGTDFIMAEETTVTGSIGVIAQILTVEGLLDKVGVEPVTLVASGSPDKDVANDIYRSWNEKDREKIRVMLDSAYDTFLRRVQAGRAGVVTDPDALRQVADGSIFTSAEASSHGLIDGVGYLDDAIAEAEKRAGLTRGRSTVVVMREPPRLFGGIPMLLQGPRPSTNRWDADSIRGLVNDLGSPRLMYLMR